MTADYPIKGLEPCVKDGSCNREVISSQAKNFYQRGNDKRYFSAFDEGKIINYLYEEDTGSITRSDSEADSLTYKHIKSFHSLYANIKNTDKRVLLKTLMVNY